MAGETLNQKPLGVQPKRGCSTCVYATSIIGGGVYSCRHLPGPLKCLTDAEPYKFWHPVIQARHTTAAKGSLDFAPEAKPDSGAHASYYEVQILYPHKGVPYRAEC